MSDLVEVAFVGDEAEAQMIRALLEDNGIPSLLQRVGPSGPQLGYGLMNPGGGSQRVMVHAHRVADARALLAEAPGSEDLPEPVNAEYLADTEGRGPRNYGLLGAYARAYLWSFVAIAVAFAVFMLQRSI
jgi:hypothetical protein